jgi:hypothetical protein
MQLKIFWIRLNPRISAAKIALELKEEQKIVVSDQTVLNCLNSRGYQSACRKPLLSLKNKKIRYEALSGLIGQKNISGR